MQSAKAELVAILLNFREDSYERRVPELDLDDVSSSLILLESIKGCCNEKDIFEALKLVGQKFPSVISWSNKYLTSPSGETDLAGILWIMEGNL